MPSYPLLDYIDISPQSNYEIVVLSNGKIYGYEFDIVNCNNHTSVKSHVLFQHICFWNVYVGYYCDSSYINITLSFRLYNHCL